MDDKKITEDVQAEARLTGQNWGRQEAELWYDQNPGRPMPEWTMGTYCGNLPIKARRQYEAMLAAADTVTAELEADRYKDAIEQIIDETARNEWDSYRNEVK